MRQAKLTTGILELDDLMRGGWPTKTLLELGGESGSGKTQWIILMCLMVQLPRELGGLEGESVLLCTDGPPPIARIQQMANYMQKKYPKVYDREDEWLNHIWIQRIHDREVLRHVVCYQVPEWCRRRSRIKLIAIDGIASNMRYGSGVEDADSGLLLNNLGGYESFNETLSDIARHLKLVADQNDAVIVCTNQVTSKPGSEADVPALGIQWSHLINMRIGLKKQDTHRILQLEFSPHLKTFTFPFRITSNTICNN
jgi:RecA/RadA recombinase